MAVLIWAESDIGHVHIPISQYGACKVIAHGGVADGRHGANHGCPEKCVGAAGHLWFPLLFAMHLTSSFSFTQSLPTLLVSATVYWMPDGRVVGQARAEKAGTGSASSASLKTADVQARRMASNRFWEVV